MTQPSRATVAGCTYRDLQKQAGGDHRPFDELLALYTLEGFLDRLARSPHRSNLVLKGGLLLAAFDARRPTRDADFAARNLANDVPALTAVVADIARLTIDDGLAFDLKSARGETIRDGELYSGVRVSLDCRLATAQTRLKVDVNVGDPITPGPQEIKIPRLLDATDTIDLIGYPLHMVHAEKIVTAIQRGTVNTRWRDFADIVLLSHHQPVDGRALHDALVAVSGHRGVDLATLATTLAGYAEIGGVQAKWAAWRRKQLLDDRLPERFSEVLAQVFAFADPVIIGATVDATWRPAAFAWSTVVEPRQ